jgi:hypothetical protein
MPEDLLLELESVGPVPGSLENIEDLLRVVIREAGLAVEGMKGSAPLFESAWRRIVLDVARGRTTEVQAACPRLRGALEKRLTLLKQTHLVASGLHQLNAQRAPAADVLLQEIAALERLKARVFDRWQTAEDLEDLAARDYPLTMADLDQIGPRRRSPASYYAEESKPF